RSQNFDITPHPLPIPDLPKQGHSLGSQLPPAGTMQGKVRRMAAQTLGLPEIRPSRQQQESTQDDQNMRNPADNEILSQLNLMAQRIERLEAEQAPPDYVSFRG
ncbi:hypothetical protein V5O48_015783, partial [Marasmius crinis-equi]